MLYIFAEASLQILPVPPCRSGIGPYWTTLNHMATLDGEADRKEEQVKFI